jgi:ribosomal protein S18 acetylase RimI-like enzyme
VGPAFPRVVRSPPELAWRALADDEQVGLAKAWVRPDGRRFVFFRSCRADAYEPLLDAVADQLPGELYVSVDEGDGDVYRELGFVVKRRHSHYLLPTDPAATGLRTAVVPSGFVLVPADHVDLDRLRLLDDALRQDVPGTDGWRWDDAGFREELTPPSYDPATYLVAVEQATGEYVGIVRVWHNPDGPRLGFIGVLPAYRRRGVARALLAAAFGVLHARGQAEVSTGIDDENVASRSLLEPLGARRTGGSLELIRPTLVP